MTHLINNIHGVEVPENTSKYYQSIDGKRLIFDVPLKDEIILNMPQGNWQIIGLAHEVTEEVAAVIVEILEFQHESKSEDLSFFVFKNYQFPDSFHKTARESLSSLLHSKGLNGNILLLKKID